MPCGSSRCSSALYVRARRAHTVRQISARPTSRREVDPDAEAWLLANWVTEPLARRELLAAIARETARILLGSWLGVVRAVLEFNNREPSATVESSHQRISSPLSFA